MATPQKSLAVAKSIVPKNGITATRRQVRPPSRVTSSSGRSVRPVGVASAKPVRALRKLSEAANTHPGRVLSCQVRPLLIERATEPIVYTCLDGPAPLECVHDPYDRPVEELGEMALRPADAALHT